MNTELKYELIQKEGELNIKTPFDVEFKDIHQIKIEQTDKVIKWMSVYPNGCVVYFEQEATRNKIRTNYPIEDDGSGNLVIAEPSK